MVSIILPVHNGEKYISRAIDSILSQNLAAFELLVIDDGSTDATYRVASSYNDSRIRTISVPHRGVGAARNRGLDEARGEFVAFLDSDDVVYPEIYTALVTEIGDCDLAVCGFEFRGTRREGFLPVNFFDAGASFTPVRVCPRPGKYCGGYELSIGTQDLLSSGTFHPVWNKLYRRNRLTNLRFDESILTWGEDELFNCAYLSRCTAMRTLDTCLYCYLEDNPRMLSDAYDPNRFYTERKCYHALQDFFKQAGGMTEAAERFLAGLLFQKLILMAENQRQIYHTADELLAFWNYVLTMPEVRDALRLAGKSRALLEYLAVNQFSAFSMAYMANADAEPSALADAVLFMHCEACGDGRSREFYRRAAEHAAPLI